MLITCPTCASSYRVDPGRIGLEGRSVRCAACRETWFLSPAEILAGHAADLDAATGAGSDTIADAAWAEATEAVRIAAEPEPTLDPPPARRRLPRKIRLPGPGLSPALALGLAALAALPLACLARAGIVRALPQSASLYAGVGLPVNLRGIEIRDVVAFRNPAEGARTAELVVEGDLVGVGRGDVPVPALAVEIRDPAGGALRTFTAAAPRAVLGPGETARFRASLVEPPDRGRAVELRFADAAAAGPVREAARR